MLLLLLLLLLLDSGFRCCLRRRQRAGIVCLAVTRRMRNELTYLHAVQVCCLCSLCCMQHAAVVAAAAAVVDAVRGHVLMPQLGILTVEFASRADNCRDYVMLGCCHTAQKIF